MKKQTAPPKNQKTQTILKGWQQIAGYLGHPPAVVQRWAADGMPIRKQGRYVETTPEELNQWLGKESGKPVHFATENTDLATELQRGLSFVRAEQKHNLAPAGTKKPKRK